MFLHVKKSVRWINTNYNKITLFIWFINTSLGNQAGKKVVYTSKKNEIFSFSVLSPSSEPNQRANENIYASYIFLFRQRPRNLTCLYTSVHNTSKAMLVKWAPFRDINPYCPGYTEGTGSCSWINAHNSCLETCDPHRGHREKLLIYP